MRSITAESAGGVLVYVMGASGAGKDTLISRLEAMETGACETRPLHVARRRITRPGGDGTENHLPMSDGEFDACLDQGDFILNWESHGLRYGISIEILGWLAVGSVVVVNGSREYLPQARRIFPNLIPVFVHVSRETLHQRLLARNRETPEEIENRLNRASLAVPGDQGVVVIDNSTDIENATRVFCSLVRALRENILAPGVTSSHRAA